jgi:hypothetical protein
MILDSLVPVLSPDRALTLAPLKAKIRAAHDDLLATRGMYGAVVEQLARVDLAALQPRVRPEYFNTLAAARATALDLRVTFDTTDVPVDLRDSMRTAENPKTSAPEFTGAVQRLQRDVERYVGTVENVDVLMRRMLAALALLEDAGENIWSPSFVVAPRQDYGSIPEVMPTRG